jgi:sugar lactone lactonase YvrE
VWRGKSGSHQNRLNDYWNALNRGAAPEELARLAEPLDQTVIAAIDRARALHRRRRPDPAFATRLEHTIMEAFATSPAGSTPLQPTRPSPTNGRTGSRALPDWLPSSPVSRDRRRWAVAQLATAVLIVVALFGFYFLVRNDNPTAVPPVASPQASPPATPTSAANPAELAWTAEGEDGGLTNPGIVALDPEGHIWVVDNGNDRFQIFDADGNFLEAWGSKGSAEGQFNFRRANGDGYGGIAFAPDGTFYVLDPGNFRVQQFASDRQFLTSWGSLGIEAGQFTDPIGIALAPDGTIWVVDDVRNDIQHFEQGGRFLGSTDDLDGTPGVNSINGLAIDAAGDLYVSDITGSQVLKVHPDGTLVTTFGASDQTSINGASPVPAATPSSLFQGQPDQMAIDASGHLFVSEGADAGGHVLIFDAAGQYLTSIDTESSFPTGVALDPEGNLYVTQYWANTVEKYRLLPPLAP